MHRIADGLERQRVLRDTGNEVEACATAEG